MVKTTIRDDGAGFDEDALTTLLAQQRAAFDESFALPPRTQGAATRAVLAIRVGDQRFALRLEQVSALQRLDRVVPLPGCAPWVLGIIGVRGQPVPAYSLARLLDCDEAEPARWLALHGADAPQGFAFAGFEGLHAVPDDSGAEPQAVIALAEHHYTVLDLSTLAASARVDGAALSSATNASATNASETNGAQ